MYVRTNVYGIPPQKNAGTIQKHQTYPLLTTQAMLPQHLQAICYRDARIPSIPQPHAPGCQTHGLTRDPKQAWLEAKSIPPLSPLFLGHTITAYDSARNGTSIQSPVVAVTRRAPTLLSSGVRRRLRAIGECTGPVHPSHFEDG